MRGCGALLVWLLVLSLAWLGPALGGEEEDGEVVAEEEAEVLSDELREEDSVLVLHEHNFDRALSEHRLLLVEFYAPWCGHCQRLAPTFARAATVLRNESSPARLGKVDATAQTALANEFGITAYPTLKLFRDGNRTHPLAYTGRAAGIVRWMQRRASPSATLLQDAATAAAFVSSQDLVVVGFFKVGWVGRGGQVGAVAVAMALVDVPFGVAKAAELFQAYGLSADTVCLFKKVRGAAGAAGRLPGSCQRLPGRGEEVSWQGWGGGAGGHGTPQLQCYPSPAQVLFVVVDVTGFGADVLPFFGLTPADAPTLRLVKMENNRKYRMDQDTFSDTAIRTFIQAVLDGKVKPHLMSAEPPEDWDTRPVKVLVGKTFEQVAFDETKNVFVKFYAPWCSHCQAMAAAWEELGERYKDHEDIVIAELDSTANELENITINGFPTLHYFPAGPGRKVDVETFSKFLENGGTLPEEPPAVSENAEETSPGLHGRCTYLQGTP
uniref:protein disulfide-isomerase n=1 Tax=Otus sunia TaxID=257818 RepID=A0A8C8E6D1_9STRI